MNSPNTMTIKTVHAEIWSSIPVALANLPPLTPNNFEANAIAALSAINKGEFRPAQFKITRIERILPGSECVVEWTYALEKFLPIKINILRAKDPLDEAFRKLLFAVSYRVKTRNNTEIKNLFY